jgi:hypothetical protein
VDAQKSVIGQNSCVEVVDLPARNSLKRRLKMNTKAITKAIVSVSFNLCIFFAKKFQAETTEN